MKTGGYRILNVVFMTVMKIIANPSVFIPSRIVVIDNNNKPSPDITLETPPCGKVINTTAPMTNGQ